MKTSHKIASAALALSAVSTMAHAQANATGTATGTVNVVQPIAIATGNNLLFGRVGKPATAGTVVIPAQATVTAGQQSYTGGVGAAGVQTLSAASFTVTGDGGSGFSITPDTSFSMINGANSIVVTPSANVATGSLSGATGSAGSLTFYVGGTASLASNQTTAAYTGTFHVVVAYN